MGLLSHGRDSNIRIWSLDSESIAKCSKNVASVGSDDSCRPQYDEIPVNSLNFCNVDFWDLGNESALLATPATIDSDNFDVYIIKKTSQEFSIKRVVENFSVKSAKLNSSGIEEINSQESVLQHRGHGIVMRLLFVAHNLLFVAYESGALFCYRLEHHSRNLSKKNDRLVIDTGYKVTLMASLLGHTPQPVLSLEYDKGSNIIYCGSASKKLLQIDISSIVRNALKSTKIDEKVNNETENTLETDVLSIPTDSVSQPLQPPPLLAGLNKWGFPIKPPEPDNVPTAKSLDPANAPQLTDQSSNDQAPASHFFNLEDRQTYTNLKHSGIQSIQVSKSGYVASFWDGVTKAYSFDSKPTLVLERAEESIQPLGNNDISTPTKKSLCIYAWSSKNANEIISANTFAANAANTRHRLVKELLLFIGYGDGIIRAYTFL